MKTTISKGNKKLGGIPNVSLPPVWSCVKGIPCAKGCYAMKSYRMYPNVKTAWNNNLALAKTNRIKYFADIYQYLKNNEPFYFRWHVAGDILDTNYFTHMVALANLFKNTKFLVFTKNYRLINNIITIEGKDYIPSNLKLYFSAWPGYEMANPFNIPVAYMQNGNETRIPKGTKKCLGSCTKCKTCFTNKKDVYFQKH